MTPIFASLTLLVILETLGRLLYPLNREARSKREAGRDHRLDLSYLGAGRGARTLLRDLYLMEKRYLPFLGWLGAPNTQLATIETNAQGFRDRAIEPRREGEYRILIIGGSFAWGLGASCNAMTVAGHLESLLNKRNQDGRYRVMNGAFMNWSTRQEYVVVTEFFDIFDPDLVISLSGYNDLVALAKGIAIDELPEARLLANAVIDHLQPIGTLKALKKLAGTLGIWRIVVLLRESTAANAPPQQLYKYDQQNGPHRVERTAQRYLSIADNLARNGRHYLIALEPEIYSSKKPLTVEEFDLKSHFMELDRDLLPTLTRYRRELSVRLTDLAGNRFQYIDIANIFDGEAAPVFIDYNHVCDLGYVLTAEVLAKVVEQLNP
jgi:hypothetical protein